MNEDMSNLMNQINKMLGNNEIPDNIKNIMSQFSSNTNQTNSSLSHNNSDNSQNKNQLNNDTSSSDNSQSSMPDFDIGTMMKMKQIIDSMNANKNDPRANLLLSLKPYLKDSRKEKVDQYIQIFKMGKVFEMLGPLGGENKK